MPHRDFFVFCTSLPPIELRAIGTLSETRHLLAGQVIFRPGEPTNEFFIVNRGMVDLEPDPEKSGRPAATLERGDIFGDLEFLIETPRRDLARARQPVSLQCFRRENFEELLRRVPTFARFLCEKLALRLMEAQDAIVAPPDELELSGNLANFDLVTVYQTIVQSGQTGQLSVVSEGGEEIAGFHFSAGQPLAGRFQHLAGDEAFWQLFIAENLRGTFSFASGAAKPEEAHLPAIARPAVDMLFSAVQFRDEFHALKGDMPATSVVELRDSNPRLGSTHSTDAYIIMEQILCALSEGALPLGELFSRCSVCELKIYQAVRELIKDGHLILFHARDNQKVA